MSPLEERPLRWTGVVDDKIPEADLQRAGVALLRATGWKVFVDRMAWRSDKGWLDVCAVHPDMQRTIFVEFKTQKGTIRPEQQEWIQAHRQAGNDVRLVRPSDWEDFAWWVVPDHMLTDSFRQQMLRAVVAGTAEARPQRSRSPDPQARNTLRRAVAQYEAKQREGGTP